MEIPQIDHTHVYFDPSDPTAWMIMVRSDDQAPVRLTCASGSEDPHEWIRDVERSVSLRRHLMATTTGTA
jgi:hypothetical protein